MYLSFHLIDMFKKDIKVNYKNEKDYSTLAGSFFSILALALIVAVSVFFFQNLIYRTNPRLTIEEFQVLDFPNITMNERDNIVAFKFGGFPSSRNISRTFTLAGFYASPSVWEEVPITLCENIHQNITELKPKTEDDDAYYCFDNLNHRIQGAATDDTTLNLQVLLCQNSTHNNNSCLTKTQIANQIMYMSFEIIYFENLIYANNFTNPIIKTSNKYSDYLDINLLKILTFNYKSLEIGTDVGLIFEDTNSITESIFDGIVGKVVTRNEGKEDNYVPPLVYLKITTKNNVVRISRSYERIQDVLANIGGILDWILLWGSICVKIISCKLLKFEMINNFFDFSGLDLDENGNDRNIKKRGKAYDKFKNGGKDGNYSNKVTMSNIINRGRSGNTNDIYIKNDPGLILPISNNNNEQSLINNLDAGPGKSNKSLQQNSNIEMSNRSSFNLVKIRDLPLDYKRHKKISDVKNSLNFNNMELFLHIFCFTKLFNKKLQKKILISNAAYEEIRKKLDFVSLFRYTREVDFIKTLLMNETQIKFFEFISKPKITSEILEDFDPYEDIREENLSTLYSYYKEKQLGKDEVDEKIFSELDENIIKIFSK